MSVNVAQMRLEEQKKSPVVGYLLWWFLGFFGGHRFYMGDVGTGLVMLAITLASFMTMLILIGYIGLVVIFIWWIIDGIKLHQQVKNYNLKLIDDYEKSAVTVPA